MCRLYNKAIDSAKFQLSFNVLTCPFICWEPKQHDWTRDSVSSSPTDTSPPPQNCYVLARCEFSIYPTKLGSQKYPCVSPSSCHDHHVPCPLLPRAASGLPIHTWTTQTCPHQLLWLSNEPSHHIQICSLFSKWEKKKGRDCKAVRKIVF